MAAQTSDRTYLAALLAEREAHLAAEDDATEGATRAIARRAVTDARLAVELKRWAAERFGSVEAMCAAVAEWSPSARSEKSYDVAIHLRHGTEAFAEVVAFYRAEAGVPIHREPISAGTAREGARGGSG